MYKKQPLLSVIIPVYNSEKFLRKCLDSVINQTHDNLEIIAVDDCSDGNAGEIISEYIKNIKTNPSRRIKLIRHKENKGSYHARITGIEAAKGKYIAFIDSDDRISTDYFRVLAEKAAETGADMVIADFVNEYEDGKIYYYDRDPIRAQDLNLEGNQVLDAFMRQRGSFYGWHVVWNKIYKRKLCKKCLPFFKKITSHLIMTDDVAFSCVFWNLAKKVANVHGAYYFYMQHGGQSVAAGNFKKFEKNASDVALVLDFFKDMLVKSGKWDRYGNDYGKFKELYIKYWSFNAKNFESGEFTEAEALIKRLFGVSGLYELTEADNSVYLAVTEIKNNMGDV